MKVLIGFALLSVALALPAIRPVSLPAPPAPEISTVFDVPKPELPAFATYDAPVFQRPALSPLMIPKEVADALRMMDEAPYMTEDTVQIVEIAENYVAKGAVADAVIVVDHVQEETPLEALAENHVNTLNFVNVAENHVAKTESNTNDEVVVEQSSDDAVAADPVHIVDAAENVENVSHIVDAVTFVDHAEEPVALTQEAPAQVGSVIVIDDAPNMAEDAAKNHITADPVHFVNAPVPADLEKIVSQVLEADMNSHDAVKVVDRLIRYPGKHFDNPLLRSTP